MFIGSTPSAEGIRISACGDFVMEECPAMGTLWSRSTAVNRFLVEGSLTGKEGQQGAPESGIQNSESRIQNPESSQGQGGEARA